MNQTILNIFNFKLSTINFDINNNNSVELDYKSLNYVSITFAFLFTLTFIFGIFTNSLVVCVFIFRSELRQFTNYFFANLSIADILVLVVCIPVALSDIFSPDIWRFGSFYCKMYFFIEYCVTSVSSLTIIFISLERYFAISKPLSVIQFFLNIYLTYLSLNYFNKKVKILFNEKKSLITIIFIWVFGIIISTPFLFMAEYTEHPAQCQMIMTSAHMVYVIFLNLVIIFIPTIGLAFLYIYIIINLRKHSKLFNRSEPINQNDLRPRIHLRDPCLHSDFKMINIQKKIDTSNHSSLSEKSNKESNKIKSISKNSNYENEGNSSNSSNSSKKVRKMYRSCSFCFSGLNSKYQCKCDIGNNIEIPVRFFNKKESSVSLNNTKNKNTKQILFITKLTKNKTQTILDNNNNKSNINQTRDKKRIKLCSKIADTSSNKVNFTVVISLVTLAFFCCQIPIRVFLLWSYFVHYSEPPLMGEGQPIIKNKIDFINVISYLTTSIYFLHCISNPIIYNMLSIKFRRAFLSLGLLENTRLFKISCKLPQSN